MEMLANLQQTERIISRFRLIYLVAKHIVGIMLFRVDLYLSRILALWMDGNISLIIQVSPITYLPVTIVIGKLIMTTKKVRHVIIVKNYTMAVLATSMWVYIQ
jgi:hypothetical protein